MSAAARLAFAVFSAALVAGCSTGEPVRTGRLGIIEDLGRGASGRMTPEQRRAWLADEREERSARALGDGKFDEIRPVVASWSLPLNRFEITSKFGRRGRSFHEGVDLRASRGTPVYAVHGGRVIYSSRRIGGYGNMVVIKHGEGLSTVYAHCSKLLVKAGARVKRGQRIALSGNTGHSSGPHLHFEVRYGVTAIDPVQVMAEASRRPSPPDRRIAARD